MQFATIHQKQAAEGAMSTFMGCSTPVVSQRWFVTSISYGLNKGTLVTLDIKYL